MKKKYLILGLLFIFILIILTTIVLNKNNHKIFSNNSKDLSLIHYLDFKIITKNKEFNKKNISTEYDQLISILSNHLSTDSRDGFLDSYRRNLEYSIKNEWDKINQNSIDTFYISDPVNINYITKEVGDYETIYDKDSKFVIVKAVNTQKIEYIYLYLYSKDNKSNYILNLSGLFSLTELKDKILTLLQNDKLQSIEWNYKIKIK